MTTAYDFTAIDIDGHERPLRELEGKVLLIVNVASKCGFTPQYAGLEALWRELSPRGFAVLGFPSNDFGGQEPGTEAEIQSFCSRNYDVTFPLYAKVATGGDGQSPVYRFLTAAHERPRWNFHKYLVGKDGQVIAAFSHRVPPEDPALRAAIETALSAA